MWLALNPSSGCIYKLKG